MYKRIKKLADEAIALQNKDRMDATLREISGIAAKLIAEPMRGLSQADIAALLPNCADVVRQWAAAQPGDTVQATGFGMVPLKLEGCASHPNDINATMTDEQRVLQLAAYERDVAAAPVKPAKKGAK